MPRHGKDLNDNNVTSPTSHTVIQAFHKIVINIHIYLLIVALRYSAHVFLRYPCADPRLWISPKSLHDSPPPVTRLYRRTSGSKFDTFNHSGRQYFPSNSYPLLITCRLVSEVLQDLMTGKDIILLHYSFLKLAMVGNRWSMVMEFLLDVG